MIGAIALDGLRGLMTLESGTTNDVFEMFVSDALVPNLHPGDIVVMDNLSSHKQPRVKALIEAKECSVLFTPPYSPEFNPIEEAWAKLKDILRRMNTATREACARRSAHSDHFKRLAGLVRTCGLQVRVNMNAI